MLNLAVPIALTTAHTKSFTSLNSMLFRNYVFRLISLLEFDWHKELLLRTRLFFFCNFEYWFFCITLCCCCKYSDRTTVAFLGSLITVRFEIKTRRPTNWWGSAKRGVAHPTATVVYNVCYHLFRERSCITVHRLAWADWPRQNASHLCNIEKYTTRKPQSANVTRKGR